MNIRLTKIRFIAIYMFFFAQSCGASRATYTQKDIDAVRNPYLFFHTGDIAGEGAQLGEVPVHLRFDKIEIDRSLDSLIVIGTIIEGETGESLLKSTVYLCEYIQCDTLYMKPNNPFPNWCKYKTLIALDADSNGSFVMRTKVPVTRNLFIAGYMLSYFGRVYHIGYLTN